MSAVASGCSGALMNFVTLQRCSTFPIRLRLGRAAYAYHPFSTAAKGGRSDDYYRNFDEDFPGEESSADFVTLIEKYNRAEPCPFCGDKNDDPFHLFCECPEPALDGQRPGLYLSLLDLLEAVRIKIGEMIFLSTPDIKLKGRVFRRLRVLKHAISHCRRDPEEHPYTFLGEAAGVHSPGRRDAEDAPRGGPRPAVRCHRPPEPLSEARRKQDRCVGESPHRQVCQDAWRSPQGEVRCPRLDPPHPQYCPLPAADAGAG